MTQNSERLKRARARQGLAGRKGGMELLRAPEIVTSTPGERIAQVRVATLLGWRIAGKPLPVYLRADTPGRLVCRPC